MDNRKFDIISNGDEHLALALKIAWANCRGGKATHYREVKLSPHIKYYGSPETTHHYDELKQDDVKGTPTLILLWHNEDGAMALPYKMDLDESINFVKGWLRNADIGEEPDHDGDNKAGWRVFTKDWGHVFGHRYAICALQPAWAMYGK
jgi:hypothetical protein